MCVCVHTFFLAAVSVFCAWTFCTDHRLAEYSNLAIGASKSYLVLLCT